MDQALYNILNPNLSHRNDPSPNGLAAGMRVRLKGDPSGACRTIEKIENGVVWLDGFLDGWRAWDPGGLEAVPATKKGKR